MSDIEEKVDAAVCQVEKQNEKESMNGVEQINSKTDLTPYFVNTDHSINKVHISKVPEICKTEPCQLGVDEAGRGPVLGPMVYGISYAPLSNKQLLIDLGCADSKSLTEEQRDAIFDEICKNSVKMGWAVEVISPNVISNSMYRRSKVSLNEVSMNSAIALIKKTIEAGVNLAEVYVDTVGKPEKYQAMLKGIFPDLKIVVAKKADSTYPIVSAASICAKVSRDHALRAWQFREGDNESEYGSGYPNDPVTKTWLASNIDQIFGFPQIVRFSWSTAEKILETNAIPVEWEEIEEEEEPSTQKISRFFSKINSKNEVKRKKHKFFVDRCLSNASSL
ncbi:ribonuclease H2 subunit A [Athalia rosae]|uniref:ribonuclease H2 subunit A n=1 Tax=Athalia rosae TaxID=37344 RepID=UPI0020344C01|nr:ribonuclease H2 subunit A [Athalia rosae]